jgi:galactose mutarotase-like enzyme
MDERSLTPMRREGKGWGARCTADPWPNRLADGRYSFDGEEHQVALSEPEKQNAITGPHKHQPPLAREAWLRHAIG